MFFSSFTGCITEKEGRIKQIIDALIYIYFSSIFVFTNIRGLNTYSNIIALALMFFLALYNFIHLEGLKNRFSLFISAFTVFAAVSILWSINKPASKEFASTLIKIYILCVLLYSYLKTEKKVETIIYAFFVAGLVLSADYLIHYGPKTYLVRLASGERMGADIANVNYLSWSLCVAFLSCAYIVLFKKQWIAIVTAPVLLLLILGTGSRGSFLAMLFAIAAMLFLLGKGWKRVLYLGIYIALLAAGLLALRLPVFGSLSSRLGAFMNLFGKSNTDGSTSVRIEMIKIGLQAFKRSPILGLGFGSSFVLTAENGIYATYLHNNYIEVLSAGGIIGFVLHYAMYAYPLFRLIPRAFRNRDKVATAYISLLFFLLVFDMFTVSYYEKAPAIIICGAFLAADEMKE